MRRDGAGAVVTCHAGCDTKAVMAALDLPMAALFDDWWTRRNGESGRTVEATYVYTDEAGVPLYRIERYRPKAFLPFLPGATKSGIGKTRRVIYRLPEVIEAVGAGKAVFLVAGEKDADALARAGVVATCHAFGEKSWRDDYAEPLAGAGVVVVMDRDDEGRRWVRQVKPALARVGATVMVVEAKTGKDAHDHLAAGHGVNEFVPWADDAPPADAPAHAEPDSDVGTLGEVPAYPTAALPEAAQALIGAHALPAALIGGPILAALATAIGGRAALDVTDSWRERAILWVANVAPAGAGKSPAQTLAFSPLREAEADVLVDDMTLEALARILAAGDGAAGFDVDELAQLVRGLGEYKGGGGGDRGRLLARWEGGPWNAGRVGDGKKGKLGVDLRIPKPTVVICGGLQPHLHGVLGGERDGLRPRWLPHVAELPAGTDDVGVIDIAALDGWRALVDAILNMRGRERSWTLAAEGRTTFNAYRRQWKEQARGPEPPGIAGALLKADKHLARVALVLAEADHPGHGGSVGADVIERAARIVTFTLDSWRALPEQGSSLGLTRRDQVLGEAVERLAAWVEDRPERQATRREIQRARVAGVRKASELNALLEDYGLHYPGCVTTATPEGGGKPIVTVHARRRVRAHSVVTVGDTGCAPHPEPHSKAKSDPNDGGDTALGDTDRGDTVPASNGKPQGELLERDRTGGRTFPTPVRPAPADEEDRELKDLA